ncbi:hypothetical protein PVAP13_4NG228600 [Panicum virgatum]|uniref:Uncharacterized protein n=1 Tax=Panicum virgatum TaxID=38727 RepID=A0A8T0T517_PANVG|nr:hypothetical protein PVAP13_4NG228600 [Panicum virgatum]
MAYQIRHLATSTTRPSTSTRSSSLVATRLASTSPLVSVLHLRPGTPRPARFLPSIPEKLSRPSATAAGAASVPPPPRVPSRPSEVGLVLPPVPTPRVAALFVPSPGCLPPPRGPCLVRDSLAPRGLCGVLT